MTPGLVTSAHGVNGDGCGVTLGFSADGSLIGPFGQDRRITDPRDLSCDQTGELVYVNPVAMTAAGTRVRITLASVEPVESAI
jgi:hypothetical protein